MTPADLAEMRNHYERATGFIKYAREDVEALCDALTAAWAELDRYVNAETGWTPEDMAHAVESVKHWRERAERAEQEKRAMAAERDMWQTSHGVLGRRCQKHEARAFRAEAALARVRDLCDDPNSLSPTSEYWDHIHPDDLRAAIEGDNQ